MNIFRLAAVGISLLRGLKAFAIDALISLKHYGDRRATAYSPRHDDLYIVSYPKSGATWMDFLMANIHLHMSGSDRSVNFFNVHFFIPDIHSSRDVVQVLPFPGHRIMKSHSGHNPYYNNVIYIIRDPRDVMVSYYHFLLGLGKYQGDLSTLVRSESFGIRAWCEHVRGWIEDSSAATRFIVIRYEDLKAEPKAVMEKVYEFLGYRLTDEVIAGAIEKSSFENMKALEKAYGYGGRDIAERLKFMRSGVVGGGKDQLDADDLAYIDSIAGKWLNKFGYRYD